MGYSVSTTSIGVFMTFDMWTRIGMPAVPPRARALAAAVHLVEDPPPPVLAGAEDEKPRRGRAPRR